MSDRVRNYVKSCEKCQKADPLKPAKKPELTQIHVSHPFELVGCDLIGPFQETETGNKYIFTATDYYTKWVEAFPMKNKTAMEVSRYLKSVISRHGAMNAILTDQGREFVNEVNKNLCQQWNISHKVTAAYHPQTNGLDERTNQTIKRALSKCVNESQTDWDTHLELVLFSLRTKKQSSTKFSPFFLLYGREAKYPSQLPSNFEEHVTKDLPACPSESLVMEDQHKRKETTEKVTESIKLNTDKAKIKQQKDFKKSNPNKKRVYVEFKVGDKVLKFNSARSIKKSKSNLEHNYSGPYYVTELVGQRVRLKSEKGICLKNMVSANNIKLYHESNVEMDTPTNDIEKFIKTLNSFGSLEFLNRECETKGTVFKPARFGRVVLDLERCHVTSFINEVSAVSEDLMDNIFSEILKAKNITTPVEHVSGKILLCAVLAKAFTEDVHPSVVMETLKVKPSFLLTVGPQIELGTTERMMVAGEAVETVDLQTLQSNNWLNDKIKITLSMAEAGLNDYFTEDEFKSLNYRWMNPQGKKIKYFVFSTTNYFRSCSPRNNKAMIELESGRREDIDLYRIKHEFITQNTRPDEDVFYGSNLTIEKFWNQLDAIADDATLRYYDCFFFMFFTFSTRDTVKTDDKTVEEERVHFKDGLISIHHICDKIKQIKQFRGKPKLFLIQSDNIKHLHPDKKFKESLINFESRKPPTDTDRLIIQSTIPGQFAQHFDEKDGKAVPSASFLVQAFLEVMSDNHSRPERDQVDMVSLTTAINGKVKSKIQSLVERGREFADILPYPQVSSTFTKLLYL